MHVAGKKRTHRAGVILLILAAGTCLAAPPAGPAGEIVLDPSDRVLILAPHPDDEVLGCGGIIRQSVSLNLPVHVAYLTNGDNNEWSFLIYRKHAVLFPSAVRQMGLIRHDEAVAGARAMGLPPQQLTFLGYPDFGTLQIWIKHWGEAPAYESMLTRTRSVPYPNALRPGAAYRGQDIVRDLTTVFRSFKPTRIFVSHPADFNVDHRALYCFTQLTLWTLEKEMRPEVIPYLVHFPAWPEPRGAHPALGLRPPAFFDDAIAWRSFTLSPGLLADKEKALRAHRSQCEYASRTLDSFLRTNELFGDFKPIVFSKPGLSPPHSGIDLSPKPAPRPDERNEEDHLTEAERNGFVGLEWRHIQIDPQAIKLSIHLSRPLGETVTAALQVFGYRRDVAFENMPKIRIEAGMFRHTVHNQDAPLQAHGVIVTHGSRTLGADIPLSLLGHPERLFVSARTYLGDIPLDWVSWRLVMLGDASTGGCLPRP